MSTLDQDTRSVIATLRSALEESALSQAEFAAALGTSNPRLSTYLHGTTRPSAHWVVRATRLGRALGHAATRGLMTPPSTATRTRSHLRLGEQDWVWRVLLQARDQLRVALDAEDTDLLEAWEAAPRSTGDPGWDVLFSALVHREFRGSDLEAPVWAEPTRLPAPWMPPHPFLEADRVRARTPDWLSALNVFVPARDLVTA